MHITFQSPLISGTMRRCLVPMGGCSVGLERLLRLGCWGDGCERGLRRSACCHSVVSPPRLQPAGSGGSLHWSLRSLSPTSSPWDLGGGQVGCRKRSLASFPELLSMQMTFSHQSYHTFIPSPWSPCPARTLVGLCRPIASVHLPNVRRRFLANRLAVTAP